MTPEEVRLIMDGWLESRSQLALVGNVFRVAFALRCKVSTVDETWVQLSTADGGSIGIALFDPEAEFRYSEPREFAELSAKLGLTENQGFSSAVAVLFPSEDETSEAESLLLIELTD